MADINDRIMIRSQVCRINFDTGENLDKLIEFIEYLRDDAIDNGFSRDSLMVESIYDGLWDNDEYYVITGEKPESDHQYATRARRREKNRLAREEKKKKDKEKQDAADLKEFKRLQKKFNK